MSETRDPAGNAEWTEEEARALRELAGDEALAPLPPDLKPRVIASLRSAGLLASAPATRGPVWLPWAAAAACALIGFGLGRQTAGGGAGTSQAEGNAVAVTPSPGSAVGEAPGQRYILLLTGAPAAGPEDNALRREEYGEWARQQEWWGMVQEGAELVNPRKLGDPGQADLVVGYFVIVARDEVEALAVAETNPHLRYGGGVTLAAMR